MARRNFKFLVVVLLGGVFCSTLVGCNSLFNKAPVAVGRAIPQVSAPPPVEIIFDASSSYDPDGQIVEYLWDFGDGTKGTGAVTSHIYTSSGEFTIVLTVVDDRGSRNATSIKVNVGGGSSTIQIQVKLEGLDLPPAGLKAVSMIDESPVGQDGIATLTLANVLTQLAFVQNQQGNIVLLSYLIYPYEQFVPVPATLERFVVPKEGSLVPFSPETTALCLVMLSPVLLGMSRCTKIEYCKEAVQHPAFSHLVELVRNAILSDPLDPLNFDRHRAIYELAANISLDIADKLAGSCSRITFKKVPLPRIYSDDRPWVEDSKTGLNVVNPKGIFYLAEILNYDNPTGQSYQIVLKPVEWLFFLRGPSTKVEYALQQGERVTIRIEKGIGQSDPHRSQEKLVKEAACYNIFLALMHTLDLLISLPIEDIIYKAVANFLSLGFIVETFAEALEQKDTFKFMKAVVNALSNETVQSLLKEILKSYLHIDVSNIFKTLKLSGTIITNIVKALKVPEKIFFVYDILVAPQYAIYHVERARVLTYIPEILSIECTTNDLEIICSCTSSDHDGWIEMWEWDFGDGYKSAGKNVSHLYRQAGEYIITLTVWDNDGSWAKTSKSVTVKAPLNNPPTVTIHSPANNSRLTYGETITFSGEAVDPEDGKLTGDALVWISTKDGIIGRGESFTITGLSLGIHTITLIATDSKGATGQASISIEIVQPRCPDLLFTDLRLEPAQFAPGQPVKVWFTVRNAGAADCPEFEVILTSDGRTLDSGIIGGLRVGEEKRLYSDALVWPDGNCHVLAVVLDPQNKVRECNEDNNQIAKTFCPTAACINSPQIATSKSEYCLGDEVEILIKITAPGYVDVWVAYENGQTKWIVTNELLEDPNKIYVIRAKAGEPLGRRNVFLKARACGTEKISSCQFTVKECGTPQLLPNLTVKELNVYQIDFRECPWATIYFEVIVKNKGAAPSPSTTIFVSQAECTVIWAATTWSDEVPALAPGEGIALYGYVKFCPTEVGDGVLLETTLVATVDPNNLVRESDESDNRFQTRVNNPCFGPPDLALTHVKIIDAKICLEWGDSFGVIFEVTIQNASGEYSPPTSLLVWAPYCRAVTPKTYNVPSLAPGKSFTILEGIDGPVTCVEPGDIITLKWALDPQNAIPEKDESNNVLEQKIKLVRTYCL